MDPSLLDVLEEAKKECNSESSSQKTRKNPLKSLGGIEDALKAIDGE